MFWDVVIVAGVFWIIMSFFSYMQAVHIRNIYKALEPLGTVYFGRDAGMFRTRYFSFVAVDSTGRVTGSRKLKASKLITFPKTMSMEELVGTDLNQLDPHAFTEDVRIQMSLVNLKDNYLKYKNRKK